MKGADVQAHAAAAACHGRAAGVQVLRSAEASEAAVVGVPCTPAVRGGAAWSRIVV